jgi:flagellar assembly protein FliH
MSSFPEVRPGVLRAGEAPAVTTARFELDFRSPSVPDGLAAEARATAHAQGYAAGWAEGKRQAAATALAAADRARAEAQRVAAAGLVRLEQVVTAVAAAARALEQRAAQPAAEAEELILRVAVMLAETVVGHELAATHTPGEDAMRRALALAPLGRPVLVRLNPADHALLAAGGGQREVDGRTVTLLPDPALQPGDAVAECDATTIDARVDAALARIRAVLHGDGHGGPSDGEPA